MSFDNPHLLWLLLVPALLVLHYLYIQIFRKTPHLRVSTVAPWQASGMSVMSILRHVPFALRLAALVLIVICLARPRSKSEFERVEAEGIDIIMAMDVSTSMLAQDFTPNRLEAAKEIGTTFISQRPYDRIGIVVFAGESFTQCPPTMDRATLINLMQDIQTELIEDGTAIGNGLATAVARLKDSQARSRVVILLTDGVNNRGEVTPQMAAELAATYGIKVYTIGVGANGEAPYPVQTIWGIQMHNIPVEIDEALLKEIADTTGGKYFRADNNAALMEIYSEINEMEKDVITSDSFSVHKDLFPKYALWALLCLLAEILCVVLLRKLP